MTLAALLVCVAAAVLAAAVLAPQPSPASPATVPVRTPPRNAAVVGAATVEVLGAVRACRDGEAVEMGRRRPLELVAYLAVHPDGVGEERLRTALWPDGSARGTFNNTVSVARAALGTVNGELLLPTLGEDRRYRLAAAVRCDLTAFTSLSAEADLVELEAALGLVRGRPFDATAGFEWAWREGFVALAERAVAAVAHRAASAALDLGDVDRALAAVDAGLRAAPCDEQLYRDRMCAWDVAGNAAAVESVMAELRAQLDVDSVDALHPDTVAVYRRCRPGGRLSR